MKQNSSILFHLMHKLLEGSYLRGYKITAAIVFSCLCGIFCAGGSVHAADKPESLASFDPAKGFKPAQADLTEIFLQIAGSLEVYGSPELYLRHMKAEHTRIEAKYRQRFGRDSPAYWPEYLNDVYLERLTTNWKFLASKLQFDALAKNTGHLMRDAIGERGPQRNGEATLADVFSHHQARVYAAMSGKTSDPTGFEALKAELTARLGLDKALVQDENWKLPQHTALDSANGIRAEFARRFAALDAGLKPADAEKVKAVLSSLCTDVGRMAEAELEAAIIERALEQTAEEYGPEQETALNAQERKTFAAFLQKKRFERGDFAALEKFYSGPYDRLSGRGKDELSKRVWAGTHPPSR